MYRLIADVESYPLFLPWCGSASVRERTPEGEVATIEVARGPLRSRFTTRNRMDEARGIQMDLVEGPFERLRGRWTFVALADSGCKVSLEMDFEFSSALVERAIVPVFNEITGDMVDAFCRRARSVYGSR